MHVTTEKKWERARYFADVYGISRMSLLRLWRDGTIRAKKTADSMQSSMFYSVADVDAYFNDDTPARPAKSRRREDITEESILNA